MPEEQQWLSTTDLAPSSAKWLTSDDVITPSAQPRPSVRRPITVAIGDKPYVTGEFTPEEVEVLGASDPAQAMTPPVFVRDKKIPIPSAPDDQGWRTGDPESSFGEIAAPAATAFAKMPVQGAREVAGAARDLLSHPAVLPADAHVMQADRDREATFDALARGLNGAAKMATPLAIAGAFVNLPATALTLGASWAAATATERAAMMAGATPAEQRFLSALAGTAVAVGGTTKVLRALKSAAEPVVDVAVGAGRAVGAAGQAAARARTLAGILSVDLPAAGRSSGYGPGDVPGYGIEQSVDPGNLGTVGRSAPLEGSPEALAVDEATRAAAGVEATTASRADVARAAERLPVVEQPLIGWHDATDVTPESLARLTDAEPPVERRVAAGEAPGGVERRNAPIDMRDPVAAAAQMRAENPRIDAEAKALAERAAATTAKPASGWHDAAEVEPPETHSYSSTQIQLPPETAAGVTAMAAKIPDEDLAPDGRETDPHVTVKYGIHTADVEKVREVLANEPPITVTLGKTSFFPNGESGSGDVLKVDVDSPDLHRLNAKIADALEVTDTHPEYVPHASIAYLKPGKGKDYEGDDSLSGQTVTVRAVTFTSKDGQRFEIPLTGQQRGQTNGEEGTTSGPRAGSNARVSGEELPRASEKRVLTSTERADRRRARKAVSDARRADIARYEREDLDGLVASAAERGYAGDHAALRDEFGRHLQSFKEIIAEVEQGGDTALLKAIAAHGGISIKAETALKGETDWLKEFQDAEPTRRGRGDLAKRRVISGQVRGVRGVFRNAGLSWDDMLKALRQDASHSGETGRGQGGQFYSINSVNELTDAFRRAATGAQDSSDAMSMLSSYVDSQDWKAEATPAPHPEDEDTLHANAGEDGDASFDPSEFETIDTLDTGEQQRRLEGTGEARRVGAADVTFRAPVQATDDTFSLSPQLTAEQKADELKKHEGPSLFGDDIDNLRNDKPLFSINDKDLIIQHNLTAANLIHAAKMGGIPVPALAVAKADDSLTNFGEITLLGPKEMADPQGYARTRVFGADIYSPRYPTIHYKIDVAGQKKLGAIIKEQQESTGRHYYDLDTLQTEGAKALEDDPGIMAAFLKREGIAVPSPVLYDASRSHAEGQVDSTPTRSQLLDIIRTTRAREDNFRTYAGEVFRSLNPTEHIYRGFTNLGNRSYKPHTLENVVAILKKDLRGSESQANIYGTGQIRSKFTPQFKSVAAIKAAKGRIVSDEAFDAAKKEVEGELFRITDELRGSYGHDANRFGFVDTVMAVMEETPKRGLDGALKEYGFSDVSPQVKSDIRTFIGKLRTMPTEYFEAKILREVDLSEFAVAIVPSDAKSTVTDLLKSRGVEIITYKAGDQEDRKRVVREMSGDVADRVRFSTRKLFTRDLLPTSKAELIEALTNHPGLAEFPQYERLMNAFNLTFEEDLTPSTVVRDLNAMPSPPSVRDVSELADFGTASAKASKAPRQLTHAELRAQQGLSTGGKTKARVVRGRLEKVGHDIPKGLLAQARAQNDLLRHTYDDLIATVQFGNRRVAVLDAGGRLTTAERDRMLESPAVRRVMTAQLTVLDEIITAMGMKRVYPSSEEAGIERTGIVFDDHVYGVFLPRPSAVLGGQRTATILLNPFEHIVGKLLGEAAQVAYETAVHEALHWEIARDGGQFDEELAKRLERLGAPFAERATTRIKEAYADPKRPDQYDTAFRELLPVYTRSRRRPEVTPDALSRSDRGQARPAVERGDAHAPARSLRRSGGRTVTGAEIERLAEQLGTSVDAQRTRAEAAGYTVEDWAESEHEIRPLQGATTGLKAAAAALVEVQGDVKAVLTAPTVDQSAKLSSRYLRWRLGQMTRTVAAATDALQKYRNAMEGLTVDHATILDMADAIEDPENARTKIPPAFQPWLKIRKQVFDYLKKQIADMGIEKEWKAHYLGHIWETEFKDTALKPGLLSRLIGRRPLQGPKTFLKQRTIPTMREGVERFKREPKTWNLVEIDLYKMQEMAKYILGQQSLRDNVRMGTWKFVTALKKAPEGMLPIPDPIGQVWAPPEITVTEAYDKLLMEGLENFIRGFGVKYERKAGGPGQSWGSTGDATGNVKAKFGGPEGVLMHEIGHVLEHFFGLYDIIKGKLTTPEFPGDKSTLKELQALAALRHEGIPADKVDADFKKYIQTHDEQIANLVHAYLYAPEKAKQVAPNAYDALDELVLTRPELEPLGDLQQMRSLVLGQREASYRLPGPILLGRYYAPPSVVRLFKNYLTPGLGANRAWSILRIPANAMVQAKLGLSTFHAFVISVEQAALEAARGMSAVARGRVVEGAVRVMRAAAKPISGPMEGRAIRRAYLDVNTLDPKTLAVNDAVNLLVYGGGRVEQSREYSNQSITKFMDNLRRANAAYLRQQHGRAGSETLGAALHALPALVEAIAYPIMQVLVPAAKADAAVQHMRAEIEALPSEPTEETVLAIASKAVNLVDASLGQVIWDNYFLPRALMSAIHMLIMAPGWRGGSAVILGRGLTDPVRRLWPSQRETYTVTGGGTAGSGGSGKPPTSAWGRPATPESRQVKEAYWSPYTSLLIATTAVGVLIAEIYQLTHGAGHVKSAKDVAFPRTGERDRNGDPERVRMPGYTGIFFDILRDLPMSALDYAMGGSAPLPTMLGQLMYNETRFGDQIHDSADPWRIQLSDYAKFLKEQWEPISVSSYGRRAGTTTEKAESVIGISPAPARVTRTPMESYLHDLLPPVHRTKEQAVRGNEKHALREAIRTGNTVTEGRIASSGLLSPRERVAAARASRREQFEYAFQAASFSQALRAYELGTPEQRAVVQHMVTKKLGPALARTPEADKAAIVARYDRAMRLPTRSESTIH